MSQSRAVYLWSPEHQSVIRAYVNPSKPRKRKRASGTLRGKNKSQQVAEKLALPSDNDPYVAGV
jgi:hypothetical protein